MDLGRGIGKSCYTGCYAILREPIRLQFVFFATVISHFMCAHPATWLPVCFAAWAVQGSRIGSRKAVNMGKKASLLVTYVKNYLDQLSHTI